MDADALERGRASKLAQRCYQDSLALIEEISTSDQAILKGRLPGTGTAHAKFDHWRMTLSEVSQRGMPQKVGT